MSDDDIRRVAKILLDARNVVALTGAGISADSGIPTFRGSDGLWRRFKPEQLATPVAFQKNPKLVWEWYSWRISMVLRAEPNPAHLALKKLEDMGKLSVVITQNVDDLHERAGTRNIIKLHGDILTARCTVCGRKVRFSAPPEDIPPKCNVCGGLMRPDVVWFGEPLPSDALERAFSVSASADAMIVIGTSGVVYPAGALPFVTRSYGGIVIEINIDKSAITSVASVFLRNRASVVLPHVVSVLEGYYDV